MNQLISKFNDLCDHPNGARLLLRVLLGGLMLFHGFFKLTHGVAWIEPMLTAHHLPGFIAYGAYIGEIVAPILIIIGLWTRVAALIYVINMVVALLLVAGSKVGQLTGVGAWAIELEVLYLVGGLVLMLLGAGKYSISKQ